MTIITVEDPALLKPGFNLYNKYNATQMLTWTITECLNTYMYVYQILLASYSENTLIHTVSIFQFQFYFKRALSIFIQKDFKKWYIMFI